MSILPSSALMIYFKEYEQYHRTKGNKITHLVGVPLVLFSLLGLLSHVVLWTPGAESLFQLDLGVVLLAAGMTFAFKVDAKLAIPFSLYGILNYLVSRHLSLPVLAGLQTLAWAIQFWGHYVYEKKSPAFFSSISHMFVGALWIFSWVIGYYKPTTHA